MLHVEMLVAAHRSEVEDAVLASVIKTLTAGDLLEISPIQLIRFNAEPALNHSACARL